MVRPGCGTPKTGEEQFVLRANRQPIDAVAFSPDGARVAVTSLDQTIRIWDVAPEAQTILSGAVTAVRLESDYVPLAIQFKRDPAHREIRSFRIVGKVPPAGDGEGEVWLACHIFAPLASRAGGFPLPHWRTWEGFRN